MASLMASSRSNSSMGFPGSYGAMPRMWSLASVSQEAGMESSLCGRVGSEGLEGLAALGAGGGGGGLVDGAPREGGGEPVPALGEGLRVRADHLDLFQAARPGE